MITTNFKKKLKRFIIIFFTVALGGMFFSAHHAQAMILANCVGTHPVVQNPMVGGQSYTVTVTCSNQWTDTWTQAGGYKLVSISAPNTPSSNIWGLTQVTMTGPEDLDNTDNVGSGSTKVFRFNVTAPSTAGSYNFRWQLYNASEASTNGYTDNISVTVTVAPPTTPPTTPPSPQPTTPGGTPLVCDPLPEDVDLLAQCNLLLGTSTAPRTYAPGTDPENPVVSSLGGAHGVAAAYDSTNDRVLFLANTGVHVLGEIRNASDLQTVVSPFQVDQGPNNGFAGEPKAVYNPDTNQYLIVWEDARRCDGCRDIYARIMNADGTFAGNDFPVVANASLTDVDYDSVNKKYVVTFESSTIRLITIGTQGNVGQAFDVVPPDNIWRGFSSTTVNTDLNEYWVAYTTSTTSGNPPQEDDRIMLTRINAQTNQQVGQTIQISDTGTGRAGVSDAQIAYNPTDKTTMIVWKDAGVNGFNGRTVDNNLNLSGIFPVLTPTMNYANYTDGFFQPVLTYNPSTNTFVVTGEDNEGGTALAELGSSGYVYSIRQPIAPPADTHGAYGNFWPTNVPTNSGWIVPASWGYHNVNAVVYNSAFAGSNLPSVVVAPTPNVPPTPVDTSTLPKLINQIYIWSLGIAGLLALLMMIIGGYIYMTAAGNAQQAAKGKDFIISSLVGIALLLGSYLLLKTINPQLTQFNLSSINSIQAP